MTTTIYRGPVPKGNVVMFNGVRYSQRFENGYYKMRQKGIWRFLHRDIWKSVYGSIPNRYRVIHKDGNRSNNTIENLACLSPSEYSRKVCSKVLEKYMYSPRTVQGRKQARINQWANAIYREHTCQQCGNLFQTRVLRKNPKCCSKLCVNKLLIAKQRQAKVLQTTHRHDSAV